MRKKYRSAIYTFNEKQNERCVEIILEFQNELEGKLNTKVYPFNAFKPSRDAIQNYYQKNPKKPFCEKFIKPKLQLLITDFSNHIVTSKVAHLS
jgi:peptide-methionine (S)-S-oxide reductase